MQQEERKRQPSGRQLLVELGGRLRRALAGARRGAGRFGLPGKLLVLTALFVMVAEVLIFLPSIAAFRVGWLSDRLTTAYVATLAAEAAPGGSVPAAVRNELLRTALVRAIAIRRGGARRVILPPATELDIGAHFDMRQLPQPTLWQSIGIKMGEIGDAIDTYMAPDDRTIRVIGLLGPRFDDTIEMVLPEEPLRRAMTRYGMDVLSVTVIISLTTAALVYFALSRLLVQPMMRLSRNMQHYRENPEDQSRIIRPSGRSDEIGTAERELEEMQRQLSQLLLQKTRLAQLGLAVSKISHDLRNMLSNAQLISDRLTAIPDPTVQQFAPKLIASLDRAISFCTESLKFGKAGESEPRREAVALRPLVEEVGEALGLPREGVISWTIDADETLEVEADREHLFRVLSNLTRNAVQAIESQGEAVKGEIGVKGRRDGGKVKLWVADDGPGVPPAARQHLFEAFKSSARKGGTGLGLAIAAELVGAHGGSLRLLDTAKGATFLIELPARATP